MNISLFQLDAFAEGPFGGNPAAVCPLEEWLEDHVMQAIAMENNLSETAFIVGSNGAYNLRWFTPAVEVDLCGHATLASAHVVLEILEPDAGKVIFETRSGRLTVNRDGDQLSMDFPSQPGKPCDELPGLADALGAKIIDSVSSVDLLVRVENAETVRNLVPDIRFIQENVQQRGLIVTAKGDDDCDFVSRFFAPAAGIDEDPVTGSAHCVSVPYWSGLLDKKELVARQVSSRGGLLTCEDRGNRVILKGRTILFLKGEITI